MISIHAPLAGRDLGLPEGWAAQRNFNPRAPCGARRGGDAKTILPESISIHAPLAGRDQIRIIRGFGLNISIHAPLAGRDASYKFLCHGPTHFNPRAPCGARPGPAPLDCLVRHFNPRAPCGARLPSAAYCWAGQSISIHAPLAGRDGVLRISTARSIYFNPRAPCGARRASSSRHQPSPDFNPRAPCGARPKAAVLSCPCAVFQSTRPLRGATSPLVMVGAVVVFQSTRPLRGATLWTRPRSP